MFNRKTEKKEPKTQEVDKSLSFYDSMIDGIFADSSENTEKAPNTDGDTAPLEEDVTYTEDEEICDTDPVAGTEAVSDSPSEENAIAEEGTEPKDQHEVDIHKWKSGTITAISEEYSEERINSNEVDDELLIALGYVNGNGSVTAEQDNLLDEKLFALKKEFSDIREADEIYGEFVKEKRRIEIRISATLIFSLLLCLYPYVCSLLKTQVQFFDCERFFVPNMLVCLQLLFIAAAFSASDLFFGFLKIFIAKPTGYSASGLLLLATTAAVILYAFFAEPTADVSCSVYMTVAAASILIPLFGDRLRVKQQMDSFELSVSKNDVRSSRLDKADGKYILAHRGIPTDFAGRTKTPYESPKIMNLILLPSFLLAAAIGTVIYLTSRDAGCALVTTSAVSCILFPAAELLTGIPFYFSAHGILNPENCALIGRASVNELSEVTEIAVNEGEIFDRSSVNPVNMQLFCETLYTTLYCTSSLTRKRRSPISALFSENIEDGDLSTNVQTVEDTKDGVAAIIDNKYAVLCGNASFMQEHDFEIPTPAPEDTAEGTSLIYTTINGKIAASICVDYTVREGFIDILNAATANGIKLNIYSSDFAVSRSVISSKLGICDDEFELIKEKMPAPTGVSPAVTSDTPAMLFDTPSIAKTVKKAERTVSIYSGIVSAISLIPSIAVALLGLTLSPYVILVYQAIITLPIFIISKIYFQEKHN